MKIIVLGAPGAGKGTQAELLSKELGIPTISTGNIIRAAIKAGTPIGIRAKEYVDKGLLASDDVIMEILSERLSQPDCESGYILDGVPRTLAQAVAIDECGINIDTALCITISDDRIIRRMSGRRVCGECGSSFHIDHNPPETEGICDSCGGELVLRGDDDPETVKTRLMAYHAQTEPLLEYYGSKGILKNVESQEELERTTELVRKALGLSQ